MMSPNSAEHSRAYNSGIQSNDSSVTSSPSMRNSFTRPTKFNNNTQASPNTTEDSLDTPSPSGADLVLQYEKNCHALQARLSIANQDLKAHRTFIYALENKFRIAEISLSTCRKRIDENGLSVTDLEIEELMSKMDAMKIQLESSNEKKENRVSLDLQ
jgi:hypothetical protein